MSSRINVKMMAVLAIAIIIVGVAAYYAGDRLAFQRGYDQGYDAGTGQAATRILRMNFINSPTIDPAVGSDDVSAAVFVNVYDSLVYPNVNGEIEPSLAQSWNVTSDGLTWTFNLKQGTKFHDGSELTAEDVKFSMDRITAIGEGFSYLFSPYVENTTVLGNYTVQFKLKATMGPFITVLVRLYIISKAQVMANIKTPGSYGSLGDYAKEWLLAHDAGTGAYSIKEVQLESHIAMERFKDYWGDIVASAPDEATFTWNTEPAAVRTAMTRRELEISDPAQLIENFDALDQIQGVGVALFRSGYMWYFSINTKKPPTDDVHFRRALSWAMDYESFAENVFPGSIPSKGPVVSSLAGHDPNVFQYYLNLDKAREELALSKYANNYSLYTIDLHWCAEFLPEEKGAILFAQCMDEIGINVNVVKTPWMSMVDETSRQETSPHIMFIATGAHYGEAGSVLEARYHSKSAPTWEQNEWLLNSTIDSMIEDSLRTINVTERFQKYYALQEQIVEMAPSLFLVDEAMRQACQTYYVDWPVSRGIVNPVAGYIYEMRHISVYPEKKAEL